MTDEEIIKMYKSGKTQSEIARHFHVQNFVIHQIVKGYPTSRWIKKIHKFPNFETWFVNLYNSTDSLQVIGDECLKHEFFHRITKQSISKRIGELRKYFNLPNKMQKNNYEDKYTRIKGYIIRNSKYMAKRRNIEFNITLHDFELPKYCPILGIEIKYGAGNDGNAFDHATLDRIDNSKGYVKNNVMIISRLANAMKNQASFDQLELFNKNYGLLLNYIKEHGTLGNITDMFPHWEKLSLDS